MTWERRRRVQAAISLNCVVEALVYLIIALVLAIALAGWLAWRLFSVRQALTHAEQERRDMQKDRAIRQNLQRILNTRDSEIRRLRERLRQYEADAHELESRASELNLNLFRESGLRILAEKEDGAKRMKVELLERQLEEGRAALRQQKAEAKAREEELLDVIDRQQRRIDKLASDKGRRARRTPAESGLDQVTMDDILGTRES